MKVWAMKIAVPLLAIGCVAFWATNVRADELGFYCITPDASQTNGDTAAWYSVSLSQTVSGFVDFVFSNNAPSGSTAVIDAVYFDDGSLLTIASVTNGAGVEFQQDSEVSVKPKNLPDGGTLTPPFETSFYNGDPQGFFAADADNPSPTYGVNAGETLTIRFELYPTPTIDDTLAALANGELRIGIHVQALPQGGASASFVNSVVPVPAAAWIGMGLFGLIGAAKLRQRWQVA